MRCQTGDSEFVLNGEPSFISDTSHSAFARLPDLPFCFVYPRAPIHMAGVISLLIDYVLLKDRCMLSYITSSTNPCCNPNRVSSITGKGGLRLFTYLFCCDSAQADPEAL